MFEEKYVFSACNAEVEFKPNCTVERVQVLERVRVLERGRFFEGNCIRGQF
jgi:hypothetical protein